jgi:MFS transporter, DHA1 family, inner membrane transport protein
VQVTASVSPARARFCLILLVLLGFSLGASEFVVIGIESDLAEELNVSLSTVGQLISLFALPYAVMTPILALTTGRFKRYQLMIAYSLLFCAGNLVSSLAQSFEVLLAARILIGSVSGSLLAVGVTFIPELADESHRSLVISCVYGAFSVAMVVVTSIGKILADTVGWHAAMDGTLAFAVIICAALAAFMPRSGATDEPATFRDQITLFTEPSIITGMLIFVFGVGSVYVFYGYVTPYLEQILGMDTMAASTTLMVYGGFCLISNIIGGWFDARFGIKALVPSFLAQGIVLVALWLVGGTMPIALVLVFAIATLMYVASVPVISLFMEIASKRHPKALTLASSLEPMSFNVGISFGTAVGGAVVSGIGIANVGLVGGALSVVACALVVLTIVLARNSNRQQ